MTNPRHVLENASGNYQSRSARWSLKMPLAGLLQVKPEKGEAMPKFKHEQRVKIIAGDHRGKTGTIFGNPTTTLEAGLPQTSVAEGQEVATDALTFVEYQVDLDWDETVSVMESDLEAI